MIARPYLVATVTPRGNLKLTADNAARAWHHSDYMIRSFADQLKNRGFVYFHQP